jgi:twitching motility protein PilT
VTAKLEQLLGYLDQAGVTEIVIGLDRPIFVRADNTYRAVVASPATRTQIEMLVQGTPLSGLIDAPQSRPGVELEVCARRLLVEVVRKGSDVAIRIVAAGPRQAGTTPTRAQTATTPRTITPTSVARTLTPTVTPRTVTPTSSPRSTPPAGVPVEIRWNESGGTRPPEPPPRRGAAPLPIANVPLADSSASTTIPIANARADTSPVDAGGGELDELEIEDPAADIWIGPRIVDERADASGLAPLVRAARQCGATDLHVAAGRPIMLRKRGELVPLDIESIPPPVSPGLRAALSGPLLPAASKGLLLPLLGPGARNQLMKVGYVDLAVDVRGSGRVRANVARQQDGLCGTFRMIASTTPTLEALNLPRELAKVVVHHQGLVVIAGPSGAGKTTTMAALVDLLNSTKSHHIVTIEDPIEIEHPAKRSIVSHREVGRHTLGFVEALKSSLREDPDVIVVGDLRDRETVEIGLTAAETGHLVLATMSTPSAAKTIDRLIDMFPPDEQPQVRASVAGALRAVIAQRLLPRASGDGVVPAIELVTGVLPLASLIRDNKLFQLPNLMQRGRQFGMIRLDESLLELVRTQQITEEIALATAENKKELLAVLTPQAPTPQPRGLFGRKGP